MYKCVKPVSQIITFGVLQHLSSKSLEFRRSMFTRFKHVNLSVITLLSAPMVTIFLHAHLNMMPNVPIKFYKNPWSRLGGVEITRNLDKWMDRRTDG